MNPLVNWPEAWKVAMLVAGMLGVAVLGIRLSRWLHAPRVLGYLVLGILLHLAMTWLIRDPDTYKRLIGGALPGANLLKSLALVYILFAIGLEFDLALIKSVGHHVWKVTAAESATLFLAVAGATWLASGRETVVTPVFLAIAAIATAPAATLHVLRQYDAKGPVTEHILAMTGLNNVVAIFLFYVAFLLFAEVGAIHVEHLRHHVVIAIVLATAGSIIIGLLLGSLLAALHTLLTRFETLLLFLTVILLIGVGSTPLGLNALIVAMFTGIAFTNLAIQQHRFRQELAIVMAPLLVIFFVLAGFKIDLHHLQRVGWVGGAFLVARLVGKVGGIALGLRWTKANSFLNPTLGWAMLCQAGVAIGLGKYLMDHWGHEIDGHWEAAGEAVAINMVILVSVAFFELLGPVAVKAVVVRAGEVKAVSLLARKGGSVREVMTIAKRLRRMFTSRSARKQAESGKALTARYVMRTNVDTLPVSAKMVEVLRFVERNRLNHFFVTDEEGRLVGTIDFRDLRNLMFNPLLAQVLTAYDMANTSPVTALADQPLNELLELFNHHDVGSLPVIESKEHDHLLGVVEQRDVLRAVHHTDARVPQEEEE